MAKKSLYIFMSALLGVFLFLILHRTVISVYLFFIGAGIGAEGFNYRQFLLWDYFTLSLALILGSWYGIWLGLFWYQKVYEEGSHGGLIEHIAREFWPSRRAVNLETKVSEVKHRLEKDLWELEDLAQESLSQAEPEPKIKRVVRKRTTKKANKTNSN